MGQVTIYLEKEIEVKMCATAKAMNLSKSKWIAGVIKEKLVDEWPAAVKELSGAWRDFPPLEDIRDYPHPDSPREEL